MDTIKKALLVSIETLLAKERHLDYIVIGSGTAGVTSAIELARAGKRVLIVEAGDLVMMNHLGSSPLRIQGDIIPQIQKQVIYHTSWLDERTFQTSTGPTLPHNNNAWSAVGGRTIFWGGCSPRFQPQDFAAWPIDFEDIEPFYAEAEELMGVSPNLPGRPAFYDNASEQQYLQQLNAAGIPATTPPLAVDTKRTQNTYIARDFDSATARLINSGLLYAKQGQGKIFLCANTPVVNLICNNRTIEYIEVLDLATGKTHDVSAKHIILAGSAMQSTRLALASGLDQYSPLIGHYISDHLFIQGLIKANKPLADEALYFFVPHDPDRPFQFQLQGPFNQTWYHPEFVTMWLDWDAGGQYMLLYGFAEGSVRHDNRVMLFDNQYDYRGGLQSYAVIASHNNDDLQRIQAMQDYADKIAKVLGGNIEKCIINHPGMALHEIGGLRMGTSAKDSVTNSFGQFWEIDNLSVCDAATWPHQSAANPYLTITALSLRHARHLLRTTE